METHPVPQNISSYEFRLVGDMTLKQFLQLAGGSVLAIIAYNMPVPGLIKFPLVFIFVLVGVLLAFVPVNNRPFSQWLWAFFKAIYSPTEYVWIPSQVKPVAAVNTETTPQTPSITINNSIPASTLPISSTLSLPAQSTPKASVAVKSPPRPNPLSLLIKQLLSALNSLRIPKKTVTKTVSTPPTSPSSLKVEPVEPEIKDTTPPQADLPVTSIPQPTTSTPPPSLNVSDILSPPSVSPVDDSLPLPSQTIFTAPANPTQLHPIPTLASSASKEPENSNPPITILNTPPILPISNPVPTASPATSPPPQYVATPTSPNILAGVVIAPGDKLLDGVTVEIIDSNTGIPARALRTNRLGQFQIAIPLANGNYVVNAEKEGFLFEPVSIQAQGKIISPINLVAKST